MERFHLKHLLQRRWIVLAAVSMMGAVAALPFIHHSARAEVHRHVVELRRFYPAGYRHVLVPRERFYRSIPVVRYYGPRYPGFGFYYDDAAAFAFLGLTAWQLHAYADLNEAQLRAHEAALAEATSAPINEDIVWNDGSASGAVTATREGHTADGRPCREFQQRVTIAGKDEEAYGTACRQPDGSWKIAEAPAR